MDDPYEVDNTNAMMELEEAPDAFVMEDVSETDPEPMSEVIMNKLRKLNEPREPKSMHGMVTMCMQQFTLLQKMNVKRLVNEPEDDIECYAHECNHCKMHVSIPWKSN